MPKTLRNLIERCSDWAWQAGKYGSLEYTTRVNLVDKMIHDYPCEAAAPKLLEHCKFLTERHSCKGPITVTAWQEIQNTIDKAEAKAEVNPVSSEMDALMKIYKLGINPISEQGCTHDVDFLCLIRDMQQVAKKAIEKSGEN